MIRSELKQMMKMICGKVYVTTYLEEGRKISNFSQSKFSQNENNITIIVFKSTYKNVNRCDDYTIFEWSKEINRVWIKCISRGFFLKTG